MATRKSNKASSQMHPTRVAKDAKEASKDRSRQTKTPVKPAPALMEFKTTAAVTVRDQHGKTSTAQHTVPKPDNVRAKDKSARKAAVKDKVKEDVKLVKAFKAANVKAAVLGGETVSKERLSECTADQLHGICREYGKGKTARFAGHSTLKKDELVKYVASGIRPPVVKSNKPANVGTMAYNLDLLRNRNGGKGYTSNDTSKSKSMFGCTVSSLKAAQLTKLVAALGL